MYSLTYYTYYVVGPKYICDTPVLHNHQQGSDAAIIYLCCLVCCSIPRFFPLAFIISDRHKMSDSASVIKIAVIGGGLAGAVLANALLQHTHIDVHVYESAPEFSERGAAIGLADNAQHALQQAIGGSDGVDALLKRAGAVIQASTRLVLVSWTFPVSRWETKL